MTDLKDRIKELMLVKKLSQHQFASMIGISPSSLSSIFNDRSRPTLNHVIAIRRAFPTINPEWLLDGVGEMFLPGEASDDTAQGGDGLADDGPSLFDFTVPTPTPQGAEVVTPSVSPTEKRVAAPAVKEVKVVETRIRRITEIRIFYEDQTWETFIPKK